MSEMPPEEPEDSVFPEIALLSAAAGGVHAVPTTGGEERKDGASAEAEDAGGLGNDDEPAIAEGEVNAAIAPARHLTRVVEAVLFAAREPLKPAQIARAAGKGTRQEAVHAAVDELNVEYLENGHAFEIRELAGLYRLMSRPEYDEYIRRIYPKDETGKNSGPTKFTPSVLETLVIIACKQPVTRSEIEHIRGVACGPTLKTLEERGMVKVVGKKNDVLGQPFLYGTTDAFLVEFGLGSLDELPFRSEFLLTKLETSPVP